MTRFLTLVSVVTFVASTAVAQVKPQDVPISTAGGPNFRLIGDLQQPLGTIVIVQGVVVQGRWKGNEGGPNLRVKRINSVATQEHIQIRLGPYFGEFGDDEQLPKLTDGKTYEFEGYETGSFVGIPAEAQKRAGIAIQTSTFYFSNQLIVYRVKRIDPIEWSPSDFLNRTATIAGTAVTIDNKSYITSKAWRLLTDAKAPWPANFVGKRVEGTGIIRQADEVPTYLLENGTVQLVQLEDQIGQQVALRGTAWSRNGRWWFNYRGTDLYVEDMNGWSRDMHGRSVLISGMLSQEKLPALDQIMFESNPDLKLQFIVRKPTWKRIVSLKSFEIIEK